MQPKKKMKKNNLITEITRIRVMMGLNEDVQLAYKLYSKTGKLNPDVMDAIFDITGGDNYTRLVADLYYHMNSFSGNNDGVDNSLIKLVEDFYDDLISYDNKLFPFTKNLNDFGVDKPNDYHVLTLAEVLKAWHKLSFEWSRLPSIFKRNLSQEIKQFFSDDTPTSQMRFKYDEISNILKQINTVLPTIPPKKMQEIQPMLVNSSKSLKDLLETLNNIRDTMSYISSDMVDKNKLIAMSKGVNADVIMNTDKVVVFKINDHEAMQEMGCYSNWCFSQVGSDDVHWQTYAAYGYVYLIYNLTVDTEDSRFLMVFLPETEDLYLSNNIRYEDVYKDDDSYTYLNSLGININNLK